MPEFLAEISFQVWCSCGEGLCLQSEGGQDLNSSIGPGVIVEPCKKCLEKAMEKGRKEAIKEMKKKKVKK